MVSCGRIETFRPPQPIRDDLLESWSMPLFDVGEVAEILQTRGSMARLTVATDRGSRRAIAFEVLTGKLNVGDRVLLNATAVELGLGTGGEDFVVCNLDAPYSGSLSGGHILKMRYTAGQIDTFVSEAPESLHHDRFVEATSAGGIPVVACGLHSQIAPVAAVAKYLNPDLRIAYVMTDGAALPIQLSDLVAALVDRKVIAGTVTCGHAFGADVEAVNVFTGIIAAAQVLEADLAIVAMGPGIVGTGTALGHTGMEQGQVINASSALGSPSVAALRISFADPRERHRSVSHHSLNALRYGTQSRCTIAVPELEAEKLQSVMDDITAAGLMDIHDIRVIDAGQTEQALESFGLEPTTMGHSVSDDPEFFRASGAAGIAALGLLTEGR